MPTPKSNVPRPAWNPEVGFVTPDETDILVGVKADINGAFGGGLNMVDDTPQGQLSVSETAIIGYVNDTFIFYQNMVDPAYSRGRMQDAIGRIYFIERDPSRSTTVECVLIGLEGVVIPIDTTAMDRAGNIYTHMQTVTIPASGRIRTMFRNTVTGPISCPAGSLNRVMTLIPGWDAIYNPNDGVLGRNTETAHEFEYRRSLSTAWNAMGSLPSIVGAVFQVEGVTDAFVTENYTNKATTISGAFLFPNSIYVAVVGGKSEDIARAIWTKKAPGCAYVGNTTVMVQDTSNGYRPPYPTYEVAFTRPEPLDTLVVVTLQDNVSVPSNALQLIQQAVVAAFAGADRGDRCTIGATVYASRFYCPVRDALPDGCKIVNIKVGSHNMSSSLFKGRIDDGKQEGDIQVLDTFPDLPSLQAAHPTPDNPGDAYKVGEKTYVWSPTENAGTGGWKSWEPSEGNVLTVEELFVGTVAGAQNVVGGVLAGTVILNQLNGSPGDVGQYIVSVRQLTVLAGNMYGVVANLDEFPVNINQMPVISEDHITLKLVK